MGIFSFARIIWSSPNTVQQTEEVTLAFLELPLKFSEKHCDSTHSACQHEDRYLNDKM